MRNVTCSSIAPTGTLSLMFRDLVMAYGIEQAFGIYYWKRTRISGRYEYYFCVPRVVRDVFKANGLEIPTNSDSIKDTWDGQYGKPIAEFIDANKDQAWN
jgi:ribonucleotide reductase alpha subunit